MGVIRVVVALLVAVIVTYLFASIFYTQQIIASQSSFVSYTIGQQLETYLSNFLGLWIYGALIAVGLSVAFLVAFFVKKILKPLAPFAYPIAGAAGMFVLVTLVETQLGGGAGLLGGARTAVGIALQCVAGAIGGLVFATLSTNR